MLLIFDFNYPNDGNKTDESRLDPIVKKDCINLFVKDIFNRDLVEIKKTHTVRERPVINYNAELTVITPEDKKDLLELQQQIKTSLISTGYRREATEFNNLLFKMLR